MDVIGLIQAFLMQPHSSTPDSEALQSTAFEVAELSWRALWGVVGLVVLTVGALGLAWLGSCRI